MVGPSSNFAAGSAGTPADTAEHWVPEDAWDGDIEAIAPSTSPSFTSRLSAFSFADTIGLSFGLYFDNALAERLDAQPLQRVFQNGDQILIHFYEQTSHRFGFHRDCGFDVLGFFTARPGQSIGISPRILRIAAAFDQSPSFERIKA
jgi:hypothetical protein